MQRKLFFKRFSSDVVYVFILLARIFSFIIITIRKVLLAFESLCVDFITVPLPTPIMRLIGRSPINVSPLQREKSPGPDGDALSEKHISPHSERNWFNYKSRRNALPVIFHIFFLLFSGFISLCVCVIVPKSVHSTPRSSVSVSECRCWKKSKPCFSLLYFPCQCVGCQLCILFFASGLKNLNFPKLFRRRKRKVDEKRIAVVRCYYIILWNVH